MTRRKTHEQFLKDVHNLVGDEYTVLGEYQRTKTKVLMKHNKCNNEWEVYPDHFLEGTRCPKCSIWKAAKKRKLTQSKFIQKVNDAHGDDYLVLGEYKGSHTRVEVKHLVCGNVYKVTPTNIISGKGCPLCANVLRGKKRRISQQEYLNRVKEKFGDEYEPIEEYITDNTPIKVRHTVCGHEWRIRPNNLLIGGKGCPKCNESKGERRIRNYFDYSFYNYKTQYKIDECKHKHALPFDFAVFHKDRLLCLIEYEGIQHYEPVERFGGEEYLKIIQKHDRIKRDYCKSRNIPLIEIPYWEENVESVLQNRLNEIHRMNNIKHEQLSIF